MSVRAYPIKKIEYGNAVFNCWHDEEFMNLLKEHDTVVFFNEGGQIEINREAIAEIRETLKTREVKKETKEIIAEIEKLFDEYGEDFIVFDCF